MIKKKESKVIEVLETERGEVSFCIMGLRPLICYRMSEKAKGELLLPRGKKTAMEKATSLKHDPYAEFRDSPYTLNNDEPALLAMPSTAFKAALANAALDLPGTQKSQIGRLTWVEGDYIAIYGIPKLFMSVVRNSDMNRTPDVRTRCIVPTWACEIKVTFVRPMIRANEIVKLLSTAGLTQGVGDWRPQKGKGTYGQFEITEPSNVGFRSIIAKGGRKEQLKGMEDALPYDDETARMITWFDSELSMRRASGKAA